jgi:clorobiocin biosynthesis protein CloN6
MVMRGYDTHIPMAQLMDAITYGQDFSSIPNILWKDLSGQVQDNPLSYMPSIFSLGMDWGNSPELAKGELFPIAELLSIQTTGCTHHCRFCGGSRESFKKMYHTGHSIAKKDLAEFTYEFETMKKLPHLEKYDYYPCSSYSETDSRTEYLINLIAQYNFKSVNYEQFHLTKDSMLKKMAQAHSETIITLSPESHDIEISKLAGRGTYTMDEMEDWIFRALDYGIYEISIWFFIGMPRQDKKSVYDTLKYCEKLLNKFQGKNVIPFICPLVPLLDPGSTFFSEPEQHGYKLFYCTLEEHRQGMTRASFINRLNYETQWLSREEIVYTGYEAIRELFLMKAEASMMPRSFFRSAVNKIDDAKEFLKVVHRIDCLSNPAEREKELEKISGEIRKRNQAIFFSGVDSQAFPVNRKIGGRWFDAIPWDKKTLEKLEAGGQ